MGKVEEVSLKPNMVPMIMGTAISSALKSLRDDLLRSVLDEISNGIAETTKEMIGYLNSLSVYDLESYISFVEQNKELGGSEELRCLSCINEAKELLKEKKREDGRPETGDGRGRTEDGRSETVQASKHFSLEALTITSQPYDNIPSLKSLANLSELAKVLDMIYEFMPITITSCFRSPKVNRAVGGSSRSMHMKGLACDFRPRENTKENRDKLFEFITEHLEFERLIRYKKRLFFHLAILPKREGKKPGNFVEIRER